MEARDVPQWILALEYEDLEFIKKFTMNSGSLKEVAKLYNVSYPTVRLRLDRMIQKIEVSESREDDEFVEFIKKLSIDDEVSLEAAKLIIDKYRKEKGDL
ncbi:DUF2089 family protein [Piscibacillus salipiscarius]|uniref:DUF2089 family protein n=1 Tax=Piscibacillus salipiscarius TaxID=299480 RepID=A0ABW5Q9M5_9BACI